jgi:hypothetical protein
MGALADRPKTAQGWAVKCLNCRHSRHEQKILPMLNCAHHLKRVNEMSICDDYKEAPAYDPPNRRHA